MVIYAYDPNAILVKPLPDISKNSIVQAYKTIIQHLRKRGFKPRLQRQDNEESKSCKMRLTKIKYNGN